jgi:hypothetical protein
MTILSSTAIIALFLAAAVLTALSACVKKLFWLQYAGGFVFAAGVVFALVSSCELKEIVITALASVLLSAVIRRRGGDG